MLNFREELRKVIERREIVSCAEERNGEDILKKVVIPYLGYVSPRVGFKVRTEIMFSIDNLDKNYLEIFVRPGEHKGNVIYYSKFKKKEGAMNALLEIQKIFEEQEIMMHHSPDCIVNGKTFSKRFSIFVKT